MDVMAELTQNHPLDNLISIASLAVVGLPELATGAQPIQLLVLTFPLLPANSSIGPGAGFVEALPMLILPALTATLVLLAYVEQLMCAGVVVALRATYMRTATLKGVSRWAVITRHVLHNALLPTITVIAISVGWLIGGVIVVENVFNYPELGRLLSFAIDRRDLPLLQAVTLITVLGFALASLLADLLYAYLNPRIRFE